MAQFKRIQLEAAFLLATGTSITETAETVGITKQTIHSWLKDNEFQAYINTLKKSNLTIEPNENLDDRKKELWWNNSSFQSLIDDLVIDPDYKEAFWENYKHDGNLSHLILNDDDLQLFRKFVVDCYKDRKEEEYRMEVERGEHWEPTSLFDWIKVISQEAY